jgi:fibronectin type 3 domain-containing protein
VKSLLTILFLLVSSTVFGASVTLQWDANPPEDAVTHYTVYYGNYSGNTRTFTARGNVTSTTTTVTVPGLSATEKWYFRATASNAVQESLYSNFVYAAFIRTPMNLKFQRIDLR